MTDGKPHNDGLAKNFEVVIDEFKDFWRDQKWNAQRFLRFNLHPKDDEFIGHIAIAFVSTFWQSFPRTLTYVSIGYGAYWLIF